MKMVTHGGHCCGIRTIYGFGSSPTTSAVELFERMFTEFRDGVREWGQQESSNPGYRLTNALNPEGEIITDRAGQGCMVYERVPAFNGVEIPANNRRRYDNRLIEVVLTDSQLDRQSLAPLRETWRQILTRNGFRPVTRFRNSNSNSYCTVFHFVAHRENNWEGEQRNPLPTPVVPVHTYYRKRYRSGNVGPTMFATYFEARNGLAASGTVNKYVVMSDGSVSVTENVQEEEE